MEARRVSEGASEVAYPSIAPLAYASGFQSLVRPTPLWLGLMTKPRLNHNRPSVVETFGRGTGMVRRPCHNGASGWHSSFVRAARGRFGVRVGVRQLVVDHGTA